MTNSLDAFLYAERKQESGGNYSAVNASSGALGAYQVMPANVASWTQRALGHSLTPQQFLASKSAQDAVAKTILGGYYAKYGPAGAAAMWYSGQPDPNKSYGNPPVSSYVASVLAIMGTSAAASAGGALGGSSSSSGSSDSSATDASTLAGSDCLWGFDLPVAGHVCILTQGQGRAILGSLLLASGAIVGGVGLLILAAYGLKHTGAAGTLADAAAAVPGAGGVAGKLAAGDAKLQAGGKAATAVSSRRRARAHQPPAPPKPRRPKAPPKKAPPKKKAPPAPKKPPAPSGDAKPGGDTG